MVCKDPADVAGNPGFVAGKGKAKHWWQFWPWWPRAEDAVNEEVLEEKPVSEILEKIQNGETVEYSHVIIKGDIDIGMLNLQKDKEKFLVASKIEITNSRIEQRLEFYNSLFKEMVDFRRTTFSQKICFRKTKFNKSCLFSNTHFVGDADFREIQVIWYASFTESIFQTQLISGERILMETLILEVPNSMERRLILRRPNLMAMLTLGTLSSPMISILKKPSWIRYNIQECEFFRSKIPRIRM